jgi:hypothetical protein
MTEVQEMLGEIAFEEKAEKWADKMYPCDGQAQRYLLMGAKFGYNEKCSELEKENAELRKVAGFQQSSNMSRYFENKKLKEGLAVGSTFNKALNSMNKNLEEERDKYRNMVFDKDEQLTKAKDHIKKLLDCLKQDTNDPQTNYYVCQYMDKAEQFLNSEVEK